MHEHAQMSFAASGLFLLLSAPFIGSFIGLAALRLPLRKNIVWGRSKCPSCDTCLAALDLIPILSWLVLGAKCRHCRVSISSYYPIMESAALGVAIWAWLVSSGPIMWLSCVFGWMLLTLSACDYKYKILPDALTFPLIVVGLAMAWFSTGPSTFLAHAIGALLGYLIFALFSVGYHKLRGRMGLGMGDAKLLAAAGAWVSWTGLAHIVLIAALGALAWMVLSGRASRREQWNTPLPFGPYLCFATWVVWTSGAHL